MKALLPLLPTLALAHSTAPHLHPRDSISTLQIKTYVRTNCAGTTVSFGNATYGQKVPVQIRSYRLNRDLTPNEGLDFWNVGPDGGDIDTAYNDNPIACQAFIQSVGGIFAKKGCTTLKANVGCVRLYTK